MAGLRDKLTARIAAEQQEIARIKSDATANAAQANDRLNTLKAALVALTPEMETLVEALAKIGVKVIE